MQTYHNCIAGMQPAGCRVTGDKQDHLHISVQLGQVPHMVPMLVQCAVTVQSVDNVSARIQSVQNGIGIGWQSVGVYDYLVQLCHLLQEVFCAWPFEGAPASATRPIRVHQQVVKVQY